MCKGCVTQNATAAKIFATVYTISALCTLEEDSPAQQSPCPNTVQGSMTQKKDAGMHKFVFALFNSSLALARKSKPTRHLSSLCSVTSWEKQPGEQADARSQLTGKAKHWGRRGRIGNLTSSQLECISATRKQAPALWDENVETRAWRELQQRTSLLSLYPKPQVTATFHKPSS